MDSMYLHYFTEEDNFPFFIQYGKHDMDMPIHYHSDFSELVIVLNGTATHVVDSEEYFIKKGEVFVINGNTSHGYKNTCDLKICNIMYKPDHLHEFGNDLRKSSGYQALFVIEPFLVKKHNFKSKLHLTLSNYEKVREIISDIINEYNHRYQGYKTMIYSYFMELVVFLSRQYDLISLDMNDNIINIAKAISYMENHFQEQINLNELAYEAKLSVRHFNRIFKENYKTTPMSYILKLRIQYACLLLRKSTLRICDVAYESGFNDSNYFTRQFKKITGYSPKEYRSNS
ncbi:HTH-type transcriptional activator RhaS [Clostridium puniceum]|uniref:HTH-type transcriptional activator RhaS n=1 Tax=Clostridium puniceum TaxID=29367 RepID=A0A1S8TXX4_9CLOT|nr:helix-turn-helix domain-containing protein [Clostridium puniceum]OOM82469.1 HTH-type transcriptional activator RhaS [Clostridium puniceum]